MNPSDAATATALAASLAKSLLVLNGFFQARSSTSVSVGPCLADFEFTGDGDAEPKMFSGFLHGANDRLANFIGNLLFAFDLKFVVDMGD